MGSVREEKKQKALTDDGVSQTSLVGFLFPLVCKCFWPLLGWWMSRKSRPCRKVRRLFEYEVCMGFFSGWRGEDVRCNGEVMHVSLRSKDRRTIDGEKAQSQTCLYERHFVHVLRGWPTRAT